MMNMIKLPRQRRMVLLLMSGLTGLLALISCFPTPFSASTQPSTSVPVLTVQIKTISPTALPKLDITEWLIKTIATNTSTTTPTPTKTIAAHTSTTTPTSIKTTAGSTQPPRQSSPPLIVFEMNRDGNDEIYTVKPDGSKLTCLLSRSSSVYSLKWSPDGQTLAYLAGEWGTTTLEILDYDTGRTWQVDYLGATAYAWSPDSLHIAFAANPEMQEGVLDYPIYLASVVDGSFVSFNRMPTTKRIVGMEWSPKGDQILALWEYVLSYGQGSVMLTMYGRLHHPYFSGLMLYDFVWDWSGEKFFYLGNKHDGSEWSVELWVSNTDETQAERIAQSEFMFGINSIALSPDGHLLAYSTSCRDSDCNPGASVMNLESREILQFIPGSIIHSAWSPDSKFLAYVLDSPSSAEMDRSLNIYSLATGKITKIVDGDVARPAWRP